MMARPTDYSPLLADLICDRISDGESVLAISRDEAFPAQSAIYRWLIQHPEFQEKYARARESQMETMAEEILEIADDTTNDNIETKFGAIPNTEWINRSRLRVDTRKWLMSKLAPKKYGDKQQLEVSGTLDLASRLSAARERKVPKK